MKKLITLVALFSILFGSCRDNRDNTGLSPTKNPADFLYQRWYFDRSKQIGDTVWTISKTDNSYDTEYRRDSTLIYRKDGVVIATGCCTPDQFILKGQTLYYTRQYTCPGVKCLVNSSVTITQLTNNLLEIQVNNIITQYNAVK